MDPGLLFLAVDKLVTAGNTSLEGTDIRVCLFTCLFRKRKKSLICWKFLHAKLRNLTCRISESACVHIVLYCNSRENEVTDIDLIS